MVTVAFIRCFSCFSWFSYCRGNCICAGQGNTIVSHFVVQPGDFTVALVCVPCGPRRSLIYACAWGFWVCWKLSAAEKVKPDCCHTPAVVSTLLTPLPVSCPLTTPLHYIQKWQETGDRLFLSAFPAILALEKIRLQILQLSMPLMATSRLSSSHSQT